jgi:hypothetical protein
MAAHVVDEAERIVCQCNSVFLDTTAPLGDVPTTVGLVIRNPWLKPGSYRLDLFLLDGVGIVDRFERACSFDVLPILPYPASGPETSYSSGDVLADYAWVPEGAAGGTLP